MDYSAEIVFQSCGGRSLVNEIPKNFAQKQDFLRRALKRIPLLHAYAAESLPMLDRAKVVAKTRNDLMHAVVTHLHPRAGVYHLSKIDHGREAHSFREVVFNSANLPALAKELGDLGAGALRLSGHLIELEQRL